jgi:hypothetical protein
MIRFHSVFMSRVKVRPELVPEHPDYQIVTADACRERFRGQGHYAGRGKRILAQFDADQSARRSPPARYGALGSREQPARLQHTVGIE